MTLLSQKYLPSDYTPDIADIGDVASYTHLLLISAGYPPTTPPPPTSGARHGHAQMVRQHMSDATLRPGIASIECIAHAWL